MTAQSGLGFSGLAAIQIPDDGATGELLTKQSDANYDYDWDPVGSEGGFTEGSVIFHGPTAFAEDNPNFFWDDTNNRLGIGTNTPTVQFETTGGRAVNVTRITTSAYTVVNTDDEIFGNTDANGVAITLQPGTQGRRLRIVNTGTSSNELIMVPDGTEDLIGLSESFTLRDGESMILVYDSTDGWY